VAFFLVGFVCGCGGPPRPETVVTGTVTHQGQPVTGGTVIFEITGDRGPLPYPGEIAADGTYELTNGVPGPARIAVDTGIRKGLPDYFPLPERYADPDTSGLTYEVVKGKQQHDIVIE